MKKIGILLFFLLIIFIGCSNKEEIITGNKKRDFKMIGLDKIQYNLNIEKLNFYKDFKPRISVIYADNPATMHAIIETDENIIDKIQIDINDNQINIFSNTQSIFKTILFSIEIVGNIKDIDVTGDCYFSFDLGSSEEGSKISLNGNSIGKIQTSSISKLELIGNGNLNITVLPFLQNFNCIFNGKAYILTGGLIENVDLLFNGFGEFRGAIINNLNVVINGEGYVYYKYNFIPNKITSNINGIGEVKQYGPND